MQPTISIIGGGKVGSTLARLLCKAGYRIVAVYSRTYSHAKKLATLVDASAVKSWTHVMEADLILLSVPDDAIAELAQEMRSAIWTDKAVIHTSGAHNVEALKPLAEQGAMTGSLHPIFPFADVESATQTLKGATFAIEAQDVTLHHWLSDIVVALDGHSITVPSDKKALYHAALVIASNYTVSLYALSQTLLQSFSDDDVAIHNALNSLVTATVNNLVQQGIPDALTGPLARADIGTIQSHLDALESTQWRDLYIALAQATLPLVRQGGQDTRTLEQLLQDKT